MNEVNAIDYINNEIVNNKNIIRGHKTINNPDSICNNGLFMGANLLDSSTININKNSYETVINQLNNWNHGTGNYIVLIEIPIELYKRNEMNNIIAFTNETNNIGFGGSSFKIPEKYIKGYFDISKGTFTYNTNYGFYNNDINRINNIYIAKEEMEKGCIYDNLGNVHFLDEMYNKKL